jgi:type II secretory pathway pseudopilin PulG
MNDKYMGNSNSTNSTKNAEDKFDNFYDLLDYIATYYILTMDFKSLSKLSEKEYCDNLVVLTSDIIKRYFNDMEIEYLSQRVKNGVEANEMEKDKIIFLNKNQLDSLDVSNDVKKSIKKKRVCIGIAKFYVKIAHIFAAIVMTINPVYTYKGPDGQTVKTPFMEKDTIPKNTQRKLYKMNICDNRIRALKRGDANVNAQEQNSDDVSLKPKICDMNVTPDGQIKNLSDEPGITELLQLYLDDKYDYSTGIFTGMSETTKKQYMSDLKTFYVAFTGNDVMPPEITKFSDIKLRDYSLQKGCQGDMPIFKNSYNINKKDELFVNYANNIKKMIQNAANNQNKLLSVINVLFTYVVDPHTKKNKIRINPKLTDEMLQNAVVSTRKFIIDLYVKCETDYVNGVKLYEAIVESKILETTQKQIENLKKKADKIVDETKKITTPIQKPTTNYDVIKSPILASSNLTSVQNTNNLTLPIANKEENVRLNMEPLPIQKPIQQPIVQPILIQKPIQQPIVQPIV